MLHRDRLSKVVWQLIRLTTAPNIDAGKSVPSSDLPSDVLCAKSAIALLLEVLEQAEYRRTKFSLPCILAHSLNDALIAAMASGVPCVALSYRKPSISS
jgi:hypothetical protein